MVFLFPGVLFRRFYFTGKASKQFNQGNLLERFLWTLLLSVMCLTFCGFVFYTIDKWFETTLLHDITYDKILNIFECLSQNNFPDTFRNRDDVRNLGIVLLFIYLISSILGFFIIKIVRLFSLDTIIDILRFSNDWQYLAKPYRNHGLKRKLGDIHLPYVDILVSQKDKEELYKGILQDFITDKDNKLEHIIISGTNKFIQYTKEENNNDKIQSLRTLSNTEGSGYRLHREFHDKIVFIKDIAGDLFVLPNQNILNLNFTYIKVSNLMKRWKEASIKSVFFIFYLSLILLVIFPFLEFDSIYFNSLGKKIVFSFATLFSLIFVIAFIQDILAKKDSGVIGIDLMFVVMFLIPYIWIFNILGGWNTIIVITLFFMLIAYLSSRLKNND